MHASNNKHSFEATKHFNDDRQKSLLRADSVNITKQMEQNFTAKGM